MFRGLWRGQEFQRDRKKPFFGGLKLPVCQGQCPTCPPELFEDVFTLTAWNWTCLVVKAHMHEKVECYASFPIMNKNLQIYVLMFYYFYPHLLWYTNDIDHIAIQTSKIYHTCVVSFLKLKNNHYHYISVFHFLPFSMWRSSIYFLWTTLFVVVFLTPWCVDLLKYRFDLVSKLWCL